MKKLLLTATALLAALNMYVQGQTFQGSVNFNTVGVPDDKRIWIGSMSPESGGQRAGAGYVAALWWGYPGETDERNLTQIGGKTALLGTTGGAATSPAGTFFGGGRTITYNNTPPDTTTGYPGTTGPGAVLSFQVRAWEGTVNDGTTWDSIFNGGQIVRVGKGPIFDLKTKDEGNVLETRPNIWQAEGYRGFVVTVPEPSTIALGLLGVGALLMLRRRK
jgi:hypothetical protein